MFSVLFSRPCAGSGVGYQEPWHCGDLGADHWPKLRSTNPLERFDREIGRPMSSASFPTTRR